MTSHTTRRDASFLGNLRAEWIKLFSVRSSLWLATGLIATLVALSATLAYFSSPAPDAGENPDVVVTTATIGAGPADQLLNLMAYAMIAGIVVVILWAASLIGGEYTNQSIRTTFLATPRRLPVLFAKTVVFGLTVFVVGLVGSILAFVAASLARADAPFAGQLFAAEVFPHLAGMALLLGLLAVLSLSIGFVTRSAGGTVAAGAGFLIGLPLAFGASGADALPMMAGVKMFAEPTLLPDGEVLGFWTRLAVVVAWTLVGVVIAAVSIKRRDA